MKKLASLREHLLASALPLQDQDLRIAAEQGKVISFSGSENHHFELHYLAKISIDDYSGDFDKLAYVLNQWLKQHQPDNNAHSLEFEAEQVNPSALKLLLKLELSEIIKVRIAKEGVYLKSCALPDLVATLLPADQWQLTIEHNPKGPPSNSFKIP